MTHEIPKFNEKKTIAVLSSRKDEIQKYYKNNGKDSREDHTEIIKEYKASLQAILDYYKPLGRYKEKIYPIFRSKEDWNEQCRKGCEEVKKLAMFLKDGLAEIDKHYRENHQKDNLDISLAFTFLTTKLRNKSEKIFNASQQFIDSSKKKKATNEKTSTNIVSVLKKLFKSCGKLEDHLEKIEQQISGIESKDTILSSKDVLASLANDPDFSFLKDENILSYYRQNFLDKVHLPTIPLDNFGLPPQGENCQADLNHALALRSDLSDRPKQIQELIKKPEFLDLQSFWGGIHGYNVQIELCMEVIAILNQVLNCADPNFQKNFSNFQKDSGWLKNVAATSQDQIDQSKECIKELEESKKVLKLAEKEKDFKRFFDQKREKLNQQIKEQEIMLNSLPQYFSNQEEKIENHQQDVGQSTDSDSQRLAIETHKKRLAMIRIEETELKITSWFDNVSANSQKQIDQCNQRIKELEVLKGLVNWAEKQAENLTNASSDETREQLVQLIKKGLEMHRQLIKECQQEIQDLRTLREIQGTPQIEDASFQSLFFNRASAFSRFMTQFYTWYQEKMQEAYTFNSRRFVFELMVQFATLSQVSRLIELMPYRNSSTSELSVESNVSAQNNLILEDKPATSNNENNENKD